MKKPHTSPRANASIPVNPPVTIIILNIPKELQPVLATCCNHWQQSPERYTLGALLGSLECDVQIFCATAQEALKKWRGK